MALSSRIALDLDDLMIPGQAISSGASERLVTIEPGQSSAIRASFGLPRSSTTNKGSRLNSMQLAYRITNGGASSISSTLSKSVYANSVTTVTTSIPITASQVTLTSGSYNVMILTVDTPAYENTANPVSFQATMTFSNSIASTDDLIISVTCFECLFDYESNPNSETFANLTLTDTTNQLVLGTGNTTTFNSPAPSASRVITFPDPGADTSVVYLALAQTLTGAKTFNAQVTAAAASNQLALQPASGNQLILHSPVPAGASRTVTFPDPGAAASVIYDVLAQTITGQKTLNAQLLADAGVRVPIANGLVYNGTVTGSFAAGSTLAAVAAGDRTLASKVGRFAFTNVNSIAADGTDTITIVNTAAGSAGMVGLECPTIATSSSPIITSVVWTANTSVAITIRNTGSAATGAAGAFTFTWISYN